VRGAAGVCAAALAAALSAHLLGTDLMHDGSGRDILVLGVSVVVAWFLLPEFRPSASHVGALTAAAACVAVGWLFLENPGHVQIAEIGSTLIALVPVLCALICALLMFARASIALVRAIAELVLTLRSFAPAASWVAPKRTSVARAKDTRLRTHYRRGPPRFPDLIPVSA
jgi:hypothetical protein